MSKAEKTIRDLLSLTNIKINGDSPSDIQVHDSSFYQRVLSSGPLGLGEAYMDGLWDCEALDDLIYQLLRADLEHRISPLKLLLPVVQSKIVNLQSPRRAFHIGEHHYDVGNDLFKLMLDPRMTYTCGYWKEADNLNDAQEAKLDLVCRKVGLQPGMCVLDIGCGFGSFAAEHYGVEVVGVTISREQINLGKELNNDPAIDLRFQDYRDVNEKFDRIISIGMFEHVGPKNYRTFMKVVERCLNDDGLFLPSAQIHVHWRLIPGPTSTSFPEECYPFFIRLMLPAKVCLLWKICTISAHTMIRRYWPGWLTWINTAMKSWRWVMTNASTACGVIFYYLLPVQTGPGVTNCGRLSIVNEDSTEVMNRFVNVKGVRAL